MSHNPQLLVTALPISSHFVIYDHSSPLPSYFDNVATDIEYNALHSHIFCGENYTPGAWCPNCDKPLLRFFDFDTGDPRLEIADSQPKRLPLLYCWTCNVTANWTDSVYQPSIEWYLTDRYQDLSGLVMLPSLYTVNLPFMYKVHTDDSVELIQYGKGGCSENFPYSQYPTFFPRSAASLYRISDDAQRIISLDNREDEVYQILADDLDALTLPRHHVGGEPILVRKNAEMTVLCPECHELMPRLAAVSDDCLDKRGFVGDPWFQVIYHYCTTCRMVACHSQGD